MGVFASEVFAAALASAAPQVFAGQTSAVLAVVALAVAVLAVAALAVAAATHLANLPAALACANLAPDVQAKGSPAKVWASPVEAPGDARGSASPPT